MAPLPRFSPDLLLQAKLLRRGFRAGQVTVGGCQMSYLEAGDRARPTVLFVHGIGAAGVHFERTLLAMHRLGYHVLAPDLPGHGFSHEHTEQLTAHRIFECLLGFVDEIAPQRFFLVGNSLGGALSLRLGLHQPGRVRACAAISPAGGFESEEEWQAFKKGFALGSRADVKRFLARLYAKQPWFLPLLYPFVQAAMARRGVQDLLATTTLADFDEAAGLTGFKPPLLLIWGKEEKIFAEKNLAWFKRTLPPHAVVDEPHGVGHCPQLDSPRWLNERLARFFTQFQDKDAST